MPLTPQEIQNLADGASIALQRIQNELGRNGPGGKFRFPAGYLTPVHERMDLFNWIDDNTLRRNLCYHLMFADTLRWLLHRTTLQGTARSMIVKHTIAVMAAIAEAITFVAHRELGHGKRSFAKRIDRLRQHGVLESELADDLIWLWAARSNIHVHEVTALELDAYQVSDGERAVRAVGRLTENLRHFMIARQFPIVE